MDFHSKDGLHATDNILWTKHGKFDRSLGFSEEREARLATLQTGNQANSRHLGFRVEGTKVLVDLDPFFGRSEIDCMVYVDSDLNLN